MVLPTTYLFVPADRPDRFAKALATAADRVIVDLEDAVKPEAKAAARDALCSADLDWARIVVRVNPPGSPFWADDLAAVAQTGASAVMVPKAEQAADLVSARESTGRDIEVLPQIETAAGLDGARALLGATGVRRAAFGHLDFAHDIDAAPSWEALLFARSQLVMASRLAGRAAPVDSVTPEIGDTGIFRREAAAARSIGFGAKLVIHPNQVTPAAAAFAPSEDEIAWARRVVEAVERGTTGALTVDGRMVDKPVEDAARRILDRIGSEMRGGHA